MLIAVLGVLYIILKTWKDQSTRMVFLDVSLVLILVTAVPKIVHAQYVFWSIPILLYILALPVKKKYFGWLVLGVIAFILTQYDMLFPDLFFGVIKPITLGLVIIFCLVLMLRSPQWNGNVVKYYGED